MHDVRTRNPPSSPEDFNNDEIVPQYFDLIGHDPSYAQISPDSDPLPTLTFATRHLNSRVLHWSHEQSAKCFDIFSIADPQTCHQQRLERWPRRALAVLPAPLHALRHFV